MSISKTRQKLVDVARQLFAKNGIANTTMNDIAKVSFKLAQPIFADPYAKNRSTGAFIVIDEASNNTVGAGMIL